VALVGCWDILCRLVAFLGAPFPGRHRPPHARLATARLYRGRRLRELKRLLDSAAAAGCQNQRMSRKSVDRGPFQRLLGSAGGSPRPFGGKSFSDRVRKIGKLEKPTPQVLDALLALANRTELKFKNQPLSDAEKRGQKTLIVLTPLRSVLCPVCVLRGGIVRSCELPQERQSKTRTDETALDKPLTTIAATGLPEQMTCSRPNDAWRPRRSAAETLAA
jgi:hypothetical protein